MKRSIALKLLLSFLACVLGASAATAAGVLCCPPQLDFWGRSLGEWNMLYWYWSLGGPQDDHVGHVAFLPIPAGDWAGGTGAYDDPALYVGHLDWTCEPGTAFVLPMSCWIGETYDPALGIPDDQPLDASIWLSSHVRVTLDGKRIITKAAPYYWGPVWFPEPVMYPEPTSYGSIGALWVQGIGFVHPPLSVGRHRLDLHSEFMEPDLNIGTRYHNTWTIIVRKCGRH